MGKAENRSQGELVQGTLDLLILRVLVRGPMHGYAISQRIHQISQEVLRVEEGSMYPALHRLELGGCLQAAWGVSENNRRARYYSLTALGKQQLAEEIDRWDRVTAALARVLEVA